VALLAANGATIDTRDAEGQTALFKAAAYGQITTVKVLLMLQANVNLADATGATPLGIAKANNFPQIVEILRLQHGDDGTSLMSGSGKNGVVAEQ
jgi:ankyrin repeat protein